MKPTEQQIQERANQIGSRPYHPVVFDGAKFWLDSTGAILSSGYLYGYTGITIRQELMRTFTAENSRIFVSETIMSRIMGLLGGQRNLRLAAQNNCQFARMQVDALLLEMARQELGVGDE